MTRAESSYGSEECHRIGFEEYAPPPPPPTKGLSRLPLRCLKESLNPNDFSPTLAPKDFDAVVGLQLASGAWNLCVELATLVGRNLEELKQKCPVRCEKKMADIWATVIMLCLLEKHYSEARDEWELLAAKAEKWIDGQELEGGCTLQQLREKAIELLQT